MLSRYFDHDEVAIGESGIDEYWQSPLESLEEATRSLVNIIPGLRHSVTLAKSLCVKSPDGLSHDESAAIYLYTMESGEQSVYRVLNSVLRANNHSAARPWFLYLKLFGTALRKLPSFSGCVWRAVCGDVAARYKKNGRTRWWAFTSCSKSLGILKNFIPQDGNNGTVFMIECNNGRDISKYSSHKHENEIILVSGTSFISADESLLMHDMRVVHLKEMTIQNPKHAQLIRSNSATNLHDNKQKKIGIVKPKSTLMKKIPSAQHLLPPSTLIASSVNSEKPPRKMNCPHCSTALIFSNTNSEGTRDICCNCKKAFNVVTCPLCYKSNIWKHADYHAGRKTTCAYCTKTFQHLNCPYCREAAYWSGLNEHTPGLRTHCNACKKDYISINCPHCDIAVYFYDKDYKSGLRHNCSHCHRNYQAINCPHCSKLNIWKNADRTPGAKITCYHCHRGFQHLNCPHCQAPNIWHDAEYKHGTRIQCQNCHNKYQHFTCPYCRAANYFLKADLKPNDRTVCHRCKQTF